MEVIEYDQELESAIALMESQALIFATKFIPDSKYRTEYMRKTREASREIKELVKAGKLSPLEGAKRASEIRNTIMDATRGKLSNIGKAWSHNLKVSGKSLQELEMHYALDKFGKNFETLSDSNKNLVWKEIVAASGRQRPSANFKAKAVGVLGKSLVVLTVSLTLYNIISAEDKVRATAKEGVVIGAGVGGMLAGGYVASLACGPGAFFCAAAWTFAVGAEAAFGSEAVFDYAW
ncbi:MAG: hypothetical protein ACRBBW_11660 [Cellvibrionaceae bacterium]